MFVQATRHVMEYGDAWRLLEARLRIVTRSSQELAAVQNELIGIAQRNRQALDATATLFTRVARNADQLGASMSDILRFTETVQQAVLVSGASSQEATAALIQLSQGLASGQLRGEEFRSVAEQLPILLDLISESLGKTRGELLQMAFAGELTAKVVLDSVLDMSGAVQDQVAEIPVTMGQAMTSVQNLMLVYFGEVERATGVTNMLATAIHGFTTSLIENEATFSRWVNGLAVGIQSVVFLSRLLVNVFQNIIALAQGVIAQLNLLVLGLADLLPGVNLESQIASWQAALDDATADFQKNSADIGDAFSDLVGAFRDAFENTNRLQSSAADLDFRPAVNQVNDLTEALTRLDKALERIPTLMQGGVTLAGRTFSFPEAETERTRFQREQFDRRAQRDVLLLDPVVARSDRGAFERQIAEALESNEVNRAIGNLGDAIGSLSERAARGIQGIRALASSVDGLTAGVGTGLSGALNFAAAGIGAVSAVTQLLGGMFSEGALERERREAIDQNNRELRNLRAAIEGLTVTMDRRSVAAEAAAAIAGNATARSQLGFSGLGGRHNMDRDILEAYLRPYRISVDEFTRIADDMGIKLWDSSNNVIIPAFQQIAEAAGITAEKLFGWADTLDNRRRRERIYREVFDITDPTEIIQRTASQFAAVAPELFRDFGLSGLDLSSETGRTVFARGLQQIVEAYFANPLQFSEKYLGRFASADEFFDWVLDAARAGDAFTDSLNKATRAVTDIPKAVNLALYRRQYGTGVSTAEPITIPLGAIQSGAPGPKDTGPGGQQITIQIDNIVNNAGDTPADLARKIAQGVQILHRRGESLHMPGVNVAP